MIDIVFFVLIRTGSNPPVSNEYEKRKLLFKIFVWEGYKVENENFLFLFSYDCKF